jgi:ribonuclease J
MTVNMYCLGGVDEAGRNMMAFEVDDEIVICDMGLQLSNLVLYNDEVDKMGMEELVEKNIIADPKLLMEKKDKVVAIVVSHAHLDHVGAVQYMAQLFPQAPIYGTPFTIEVLKVLMKSQRTVSEPLKNKFIKVNVNSTFTTPKGMDIELINVTHSIPQTAIVAMHSKEGVIMYANDFKFDNRPALGQRTNYERLREVNELGIKLLVVDSVRSNLKRKTLSEIVVKEMLRDIFIETDIVNTQAVVITTFASHITRLKSIMELTSELGRKLIFMGRSIAKYTKAAKNAGIIDFREKDVIICETPAEVNKWMDIVNKNKRDYIIVCTGHQGEENAVMSKIAEGRTPFELKEDDKVIFSSEVIPTQVNIEARQILDAKLESYRCKIFKDIHVSGHASREDHRDLLSMIKPKHIVPVHGHVRLKEGMIELAEELGYEQDKNLWVVPDGGILKFD